jgi:ABC-type uncharacterized transport system permease subunit
LPGFFDQNIGLAIAALFFILAISVVIFIYYFLARRRFGGTVKAGGKSDINGSRDE